MQGLRFSDGEKRGSECPVLNTECRVDLDAGSESAKIRVGLGAPAPPHTPRIFEILGWACHGPFRWSVFGSGAGRPV